MLNLIMGKIKILKKNSFFVAIVMVGAITLIPVFSKLEDLAQRNSEIKLKMIQVTSENRMLLERQRRLQTEPVFAESVARQRLNVAKEGEVIYKILPEEK